MALDLRADKLNVEIAAEAAKKAAALHRPLAEPMQRRSLTSALHEKLSDEELLSMIEVSELDPFYVPPEEIPDGMIYQWWTKEVWGASSQAPIGRVLDAERTGWQFVPASRHPGRWMPAGYDGNIEHGGMVLMELPEAAAYNRARAQYLLATRTKAGSLERLNRAPDGTGPRTHPGVRPSVSISREAMPVE